MSDRINTDNKYKHINYEKDGKWRGYDEVRQKSNASIKICCVCGGCLVYAGTQPERVQLSLCV